MITEEFNNIKEPRLIAVSGGAAYCNLNNYVGMIGKNSIFRGAHKNSHD
jgi:hypothetical protein